MQKKCNSPLEIGSRVLVIPQSTAQSLKMRVGIVSADITNKEKIEIMYDDEVTSLYSYSLILTLIHLLTHQGTEDEEICDIKNIIPIINPKVMVDNGDIGYHIQLALYSNIAKCYLSLKKYGWLIRYSTILITLITTDECEAEGVIDKNVLTHSLTYLPTYLGVIEPAGEMIIGSIIGYFIYLILYLIDLNGNQLQGTHLLTHSITTLRSQLPSLLLT